MPWSKALPAFISIKTGPAKGPRYRLPIGWHVMMPARAAPGMASSAPSLYNYFIVQVALSRPYHNHIEPGGNRRHTDPGIELPRFRFHHPGKAFLAHCIDQRYPNTLVIAMLTTHNKFVQHRVGIQLNILQPAPVADPKPFIRIRCRSRGTAVAVCKHNIVPAWRAGHQAVVCRSRYQYRIQVPLVARGIITQEIAAAKGQ